MTQETQLAKLGLFDAKVPRYTSYPTAPHFQTDFGNQTLTTWIKSISEGDKISLYVHVPFCRRLCWFCACRTQGTQTDDPVNAYLAVLLQELALLRETLPAGVTLSRLHWGGGTPTLLSPAMMERLAKAIFDVVPLAPQAEFSVEIDPNEIDADRLAVLSAAGMNRASIGVQDFDPQIQETIGRRQSFDLTRRAVDIIRNHSIYSLNADILFGLPHQTPARITESVQKLLSLDPDRVALYGYAHVPWMAKRQQMIPSEALPSPQERLQLFETAQRLFRWDGYTDIGIDHFAKPTDGLSIAQKTGKLRRNFQGYTDDASDVLIGLGASAISRFPQGYAQNAPSTSSYIKAIRGGQFATEKGHRFTADDRLRGRIIELLMCDFAVDGEALIDQGLAQVAELNAMFSQAQTAFPDVLHRQGLHLTIPKTSRPLTRMIARCFDAYSMSQTSHSSAI